MYSFFQENNFKNLKMVLQIFEDCEKFLEEKKYLTTEFKKIRKEKFIK